MSDKKAELAELSAFPHILRKVNFRECKTMPSAAEVVEDVEDANLFTSELAHFPGWHTIALDLDVPARLVPSTTEGHSHLYVDVMLPWAAYEKLLEALAVACVIEPGYLQASKVRRWTSLRLPWIRKQPGEGSSE